MAKQGNSRSDLQAEFDLVEEQPAPDSEVAVEAEAESEAELEDWENSSPSEEASEEVSGREGEAEEEAEPIPEQEEERVQKLVNGQEGCWKILEDGSRIDLTEEEWRTELARHFKRESPPPI